MKKTMKNGLIAMLFVLLALCFVSCGGNDSKGGSGNGGSTEADFLWTDITKTLSVFLEDDNNVTILINQNIVTVTLFTSDGSKPDYDTLMIQGASTEFNDCSAQATYVQFTGNEDNLPTTAGNWAVDFTKSSDSTVLYSFTIPKEYTTKMLAALQ